MQRLRAPTTDRGDCSWDGLMAAAQCGDASAYRHLLSEVAMWLRRYYALLLEGGDMVRVVKVRDDSVTILGERPYRWSLEKRVGRWWRSFGSSMCRRASANARYFGVKVPNAVAMPSLPGWSRFTARPHGVSCAAVKYGPM